MCERDVSVVYAGWIKDTESRMKSSSGGMFSAFSKCVIEQGGVVYAVAETEEGLKYSSAGKYGDIDRMRGSKYYQADTSKLNIALLIHDIETKPVVLLVGTACQIAMFKTVIQDKFCEIPQNVILVDIICHGVASKKSVDKYRSELERKHGRLLNHTFRSKAEGKIGSRVSCYSFESGREIYIDNEKDYFMRFYSPAFFLRESCYVCKYAGKNRISDISIGDFNGVNRVMRNFPDSTHCVSSVLVNTSKGSTFLNQVKEADLIVLRETSYEMIAEQNLPLQYPTERPIIRNYAIRLIDVFGFIRTSRMISGKFYLRMLVIKFGGERLLKYVKRKLGRKIIEP